MLQSFRQFRNPVVILLGIALLVMWLTGAHAHRATHPHDKRVQSAHGHFHDAHDTATHAEPQPLDVHAVAHAVGIPTGDLHSDIKLTALRSLGKSLSELPVLALLLFVALLLPRPRALAISSPPEPPARPRMSFRLSPPLRGPPVLTS